MNLTDDQRFAADNLLAAQERRGLHLESIPAQRLAVVMQVLAARKVELFNARYSVGAPVMYIPGVGKKPRRERVYRAARVENGRAIVELAGTLLPIDVDQCFTVGDEQIGHRAACLRGRSPPPWPPASCWQLSSPCSSRPPRPFRLSGS